MRAARHGGTHRAGRLRHRPLHAGLLDTFPIDQLKLDRSFLREQGHDRIAIAVVKIAQAQPVTSMTEALRGEVTTGPVG